MRLCASFVLAILMTAAPLAADPSAPSRDDWVKLVSYADYTCHESVVAASCDIDIRTITANFVEIRKRYTLTDEQRHTLDDRLTTCLEGHAPSPKMDVDPKICTGAKHAVSEQMRLFRVAPSQPH